MLWDLSKFLLGICKWQVFSFFCIASFRSTSRKTSDRSRTAREDCIKLFTRPSGRHTPDCCVHAAWQLCKLPGKLPGKHSSKGMNVSRLFVDSKQQSPAAQQQHTSSGNSPKVSAGTKCCSNGWISDQVSGPDALFIGDIGVGSAAYQQIDDRRVFTGYRWNVEHQQISLLNTKQSCFPQQNELCSTATTSTDANESPVIEKEATNDASRMDQCHKLQGI